MTLSRDSTSRCPTPTKTAHRTEKAALREAKSVQRRRGEYMEPYRCQCGNFHVTSRPQGKIR